MAKSYGQCCPLSIAVELLCQRWTLLVVSRLFYGCSRFNEIHRGVPRMSRSLLSKRLAELESAGLVESHPNPDGGGKEYLLTRSGMDLEPILGDLAMWGQQWGRDMTDDDLDPAFLVWSMHQRMNFRAMPAGRTVIEVSLGDSPSGRQSHWLVHEAGVVEMFLKDPGLDVDLRVSSDLRLFAEVWRGFRDLRQEIEKGHVELHGPPELAEGFPNWLHYHPLARCERLRPGRERELSKRKRR